MEEGDSKKVWVSLVTTLPLSNVIFLSVYVVCVCVCVCMCVCVCVCMCVCVCVCVLLNYTIYISILYIFVFHRKNLVLLHLISRRVTSKME